MAIRQQLHDAGHCVRAAAPPVLTLGVLTLARTAHPGSTVSTSMDELILLVWRGGTSATLVWLIVAVSWAANRPWRDRRAFQRLQHLREMGATPDRALVRIQTTVCSSTAGQHVVVVNVAAGGTSHIWISETTVPIGAFVVLERTNGGACVLEWINAHQVEAGHRHEQRHVAHRPTGIEPRLQLLEQENRDAAQQLIAETEQFLKEQEDRHLP